MKPFFNNNQGLYKGSQPPFYDVSTIEGLDKLQAATARIHAELLSNLKDEEKAKICFQKNTLRRDAGWRQIELKIYGVEYPKRMALFPETMQILNQIPGVSTVYFSLLGPQAKIKPHVGDTDAYYRAHLGLKIPAGLPACGIEVAGMWRGWQEGGCIAFNDIYCHAAWNDTAEERVVLILDILRPEFRKQVAYINIGVRATLYYSRLSVLVPLEELLPRGITRLGRPLFHMTAYCWSLLSKRLIRFFRRGK